jgi:carotenoid cleavage dioxygenase-like enzyme
MLEIVNEVRLTLNPNTDNPYLKGPFRSNPREYNADTRSLKVIGEIPKDLDGMYVRNHHNQIHEPMGTYHPFDGDGMLHAILFKDGKADYRNRFVRTTGFYAEQAAGRSLWTGLLDPDLGASRGWGAIGAMKDNAGTDIKCHAGLLLATMSQGSEPYRLDPFTLETLGPDPKWARKIPDGLSSHYKVDNHTGEMMFFNYPEHPPYMNYGVVDKENNLVHYVPVELPGARWPHDLGITQNYTVLHDLPLYFDPEGLKHGKHKLIFNREQPSRFGVIPRYGNAASVRWFETSPCYILHITNCFELGDEVIMDGCIMPNYTPIPVNMSGNIYDRITANLDKHNNPTLMHRWRFNMKTGQAREERIDDEITEFPVCSNDYVGRPYRYSYNVLYKKGAWLFSGLKRFDMLSGKTARYEYGEGRYGSEPQVARALNAKTEDDGYVITMIADMVADTSEVMILRADDIAAGPVARIMLPERMGIGVHACWVEGDRMNGENRTPVLD